MVWTKPLSRWTMFEYPYDTMLSIAVRPFLGGTAAQFFGLAPTEKFYPGPSGDSQ